MLHELCYILIKFFPAQNLKIAYPGVKLHEKNPILQQSQAEKDPDAFVELVNWPLS